MGAAAAASDGDSRTEEGGKSASGTHRAGRSKKFGGLPLSRAADDWSLFQAPGTFTIRAVGARGRLGARAEAVQPKPG